MSTGKEILEDFIRESKKIIQESIVVLDKVEGNLVQAKNLKDYGNLVDRIMGGAKSVALGLAPSHALNLVSDYAAVCKAVGYKASQISDNEQFFDVCVALLQDATETLDTLLGNVDKSRDELRKSFSSTFIDRLSWVSKKFSSEYHGTVGVAAPENKTLVQSEIDELIKKLGA